MDEFAKNLPHQPLSRRKLSRSNITEKCPDRGKIHYDFNIMVSMYKAQTMINICQQTLEPFYYACNEWTTQEKNDLKRKSLYTFSINFLAHINAQKNSYQIGCTIEVGFQKYTMCIDTWATLSSFTVSWRLKKSKYRHWKKTNSDI